MDVRVYLIILFVNFVSSDDPAPAAASGAAVVQQTTENCQTYKRPRSTFIAWDNFTQLQKKRTSQIPVVTEEKDQAANPNPKPVSKYAGLGGQLLDELSKGKDDHEKLKVLSAIITQAIKQNLQESSDIPPLEINMFGKYVCGGNGTVSNFTSIRQVQTTVCDKEDSHEIRIEYSFDKLKFHYERFFVQSMGFKGLEGELDLPFKENKIEVVIGVPSVKRMVEKIPLNIENPSAENCIIRILDFNAVVLVKDNHNLLANRHVRRTVFSSQMYSYFREHEGELKSRFESQALQEVYRILTEESTLKAWVCNDDNLKELIKGKTEKVKDPKESSKFKAHCA